MKETQFNVMQNIRNRLGALTPKGRILGEYILENPRKAVFMTTKELSETCGVSEATVVRFVSRINYKGYGEFLQMLRDYVDSEMTLRDRIDLPDRRYEGGDSLRRVLAESMDNLREMYESIDREALNRFAAHLSGPKAVYTVGSRVSFTFAYYLGWSLSKIRQGVRILKASDSAAIDWLANAPEDSIAVIFATSRYPNELIKMGKLTRRLNHTLLVVADSALCPLIQFAHESLVAPSRTIPIINDPTPFFCIINYLILELANRSDTRQKLHQEKLERIYRENDLLYNLYGTY